MNNRQRRLDIIQSIQNSRNSKLITYVTGDRPGATAQIGQDAVRPMYDHLRPLGFGKVPKIDLFLYSQGGAVDVPWRIVTMLRECCDELSILVPFKAQSAATLIALGGDSIIMGKKAELGPIDPALTMTPQGEQTAVQENIRVEDVMAYIDFLKKRAGLGDQAAIAAGVQILSERLRPWVLGSIYRTHSHIRTIARNLLVLHRQPLEERQINLIVEQLAEKIYSHGHSIGRAEAIEIGLPVEKPDEELENWMWDLLEEYEEMMQLGSPIDPAAFIPPEQDQHEEEVTLACIESIAKLHVFGGRLQMKHSRAMPPQLSLTLNINMQLPPNLNVESLPADAQQVLQQMVQQAMQIIQEKGNAIVQSELKRQAPIQKTEGGLRGAAWRETTKSV